MKADILCCPCCGQQHAELEFSEKPSWRGPTQTGFCPITGEPLAWQYKPEQHTPIKPPSPSGKSILLTGGIGDIFAIESFMSDGERSSIERIYYACPSADTISELFKALPNFTRLKDHVYSMADPAARTKAPAVFPKHVILSNSNKVYFNREMVSADWGPVEADDLSFMKVVPSVRQANNKFDAIFSNGTERRYSGSSFLKYKLCDVQKPVSPYVIICPTSSRGKWLDREFTDNEWDKCVRFLKDRDLTGVILHDEPINRPKSRRIIQPKTNILQAVELLKGAKGYIGIDTCWSVLAAKMFQVIAVKAVSDFTWQWKHVYYAPKKTIDFMSRELVLPKVLS